MPMSCHGDRYKKVPYIVSSFTTRISVGGSQNSTASKVASRSKEGNSGVDIIESLLRNVAKWLQFAFLRLGCLPVGGGAGL